MNDTQLKEYLGAMITEYDKLVIGEYNREEGRKEGIEIGRAEGRAEGEAEGRAEGRAEERLQIAQKMLAAGIPVEQVLSITGLSPEELDALKKA